MAKKNKLVKKGKLYFRILKRLMTIKYKSPKFIFLGDEFEDGSVILSNHEGTDAPMALEMYMDRKFRMWGAHEMNSGLKMMYKYQTEVYYHQKKGWNLTLAKLFCLLASPLTNLFYSGFPLISTYKDQRFFKTIKESINAIKNKENVVIFPEDSTNGYLPELEGFLLGFTGLGEVALKRGVDIPIVVSYYVKKTNTYIFDQPISYSSLVKEGLTKEQIADKLLKRCNQLGKMNFDKKTDK